MTRQHMSLVPTDATDSEEVWLRRAVVQDDSGVIVHVVTETEDLPRLAGVIAALEARMAFEQIVLDAGADVRSAPMLDDLGARVKVVRLPGAPAVPQDVEAALAASDPTAVV